MAEEMNQGFDNKQEYEKVIKEITEATDTETNTQKEIDDSVEEDKEGVEKRDEFKDKNNDDPDKEYLEMDDKENEGEDSKKNKEDDGGDDEILGKTPEEIQELIDKRTQEALEKHETGLKEFYEAQSNEERVTNQLKEIEGLYGQYTQSIQQVDKMLENGEITPQQYKEAIARATSDMNLLKTNYEQLQQYSKQIGLPKVKRNNDEYYKKLQAETVEFKDPIVNKYAKNLKEKVYDAGGIDLAEGGFYDYVKGFISQAVQEAEIRGYQKVKNELQKQSAKAKAKSVAQDGDSLGTDSQIRTADDILNASKDDLVKAFLK